jgi:hypothetical protein
VSVGIDFLFYLAQPDKYFCNFRVFSEKLQTWFPCPADILFLKDTWHQNPNWEKRTMSYVNSIIFQNMAK